MQEITSQTGPKWVEEGGYYLISRYEEVTQVCLKPKVFSSNLVAFVLKGAGEGTQIMEILIDQSPCWIRISLNLMANDARPGR